MTLPAVSTKNNLDSASDDPSQARVELAQLIDNVNQIRTHLGLSAITNSAGPATPGGGLEVAAAVLQAKANFRNVTGADTIVESDRGKVLDCTSAGFSLGATAAATLGDGFYCWVRNSAASGNITVDPNAGETIDGAATLVLPPGRMTFIGCNGSLLRSGAGKFVRQGTPLVQNPYTLTTTTSQSHNLPGRPNMPAHVEFECLSNDGTWNAGEFVDWTASNSGDANNATAAAFLSIEATATQIRLIMGNVAPTVVSKSTGNYEQITPAKWKVVITPYFYG